MNKFDVTGIFNADKSGFFYKKLPIHTLALKSESFKKRLTILIEANMTRLEKLPLLLIEKSQKPRSFCGTNVTVKYVANSSA